MKVIQKKTENLPKTWSKKVSCAYCQSILEVDGYDLNLSESVWRHEIIKYLYFYCPVCEEALYLPEKIYPEWMELYLESSTYLPSTIKECTIVPDGYNDPGFPI